MFYDLKQLVYKMSTRPSCPIAIIGPPGCGKTAQAKQAGEELGYPTQVFIASTCDETDIAGMPVYKDGATVVITPKWGLEFQKRPGLLILDEFNCARPEVLHAMLTLIQDRIFPNGEDRLHEETIILALMNDAAMVGNEELSPAMNNRFGWVEVGMPEGQEYFNWLSTGSVRGTTEEQRKAQIKNLSKPVTLDQWLNWMRAKPENGADIKDIVDRVMTLGLKFANNDNFINQRKVCTPRAVTNLLYFAGSAENVKRYASMFIDPQNANLFRTAYDKMKNDAANTAWSKSKRGTYGSDDDQNMSNSKVVEEKVQARLKQAHNNAVSMFGKILGTQEENAPDELMDNDSNDYDA